MRSSRAQAALLSLLLLLATAAVYLPVAGHGFLYFDDPWYVTQNPQVLSGLTAKGVAWAFTSFHAAGWMPLDRISHMAAVEFFGLAAGWHHLVNLALHGANTVLLFLFFRGATGFAGRSAFVAALFALHPLHVESVAWISERKDVLCAFFSLLVLHAWAGWARKGGRGRYAAALLLYALALLSKPMAVTLPFLLLLVDRWPLGREAAPITDRVREKIPFFLLSAASCIVTVAAQRRSGTVSGLDDLSMAGRLATAVMGYGTYLGKLAWPARLAVFYPFPPALFPLGAVAATFLALLLASLLAWRAWRSAPWIPAGWFWFLGTLVPVIGLLHVGGHFVADRYTYLPSVGLFAAAAWAVPEALPPGRRRAAPLASLAVLVAVLLALLSGYQLRYWTDDDTLFRHTVEVTEENWAAHTHLGVYAAYTGRLDQALVHLDEAVRIHPGSARARSYRATALAQVGRVEEAFQDLRTAVAADPGYAEPRNNLGILLSLRGEYAEAEACFLEAKRLGPDYADADYNLALAYRKEGRLAEAAERFREVLRLRPMDRGAAERLSEVVREMGRKGEGGGR